MSSAPGSQPSRPRPTTRRAALAIGAAGLLAGCTNTPSEPARPGRFTEPRRQPAPAPRPATLPSGARRLFPEHRLVGLCGAPGATALGRMTGDPAVARSRLLRQVGDYSGERRVLPVVELIATVASQTPGEDGMYRIRSADATVADYLRQARSVDGLLLLNIQPGRADFVTEVRAYRSWLTEPDVGVALDPEWAMPPGAVPGEQYGSTTGAELDRVAGYLAGLVRRHDLPEKVLAYHQVAASVVTGERELTRHAGVACVKSVDGIGSRAMKVDTWQTLVDGMPEHVRTGFKLFYSEDTESGPLMTPAQVLSLRPKPDYVLYE